MRIAQIEDSFRHVRYVLEEATRKNNAEPELLKYAQKHLTELENDLVSEQKQRVGGDKRPRMTNAQRDRLWLLCGNYGVIFRESDYIIDAHTGWCEGWIGGSGNTIYVGVSPEGDSHS